MSFRKHSLLLAGLGAVLTGALMGCDVKVGETAPAAEVREFKTAECLSNTVPSVKNFFKGSANDLEVAETWDCVAAAVTQFRKYVRGQEKDRYTPQEMATFLEKNFLKDDGRKINIFLQAEVMKVKRIFVGGSLEYLTMTDLDQLVDLSLRLKRMTRAINPYMKVFSQNWAPSQPLNSAQNLDYFELANRQIQSFAQELSAPGLESYRIADAIALTRELDIFISKPGQREHNEELVARYVPLIQKLKKALAGGAETTVQKADWRNMLFGAGRGYVQYLRYQYFIKSSASDTDEVRLNFITRLLEDSISTLGDLVAKKPAAQITASELNEVLTEASKVWTGFKVTDQLVPQIMQLKQLLFGGDLVVISLADLQRGESKLGLVQSLALQVLPYYQIYAGNWKMDSRDSEANLKLFAAAQAQLMTALASAGQIFETDFDLNKLPDMVHEIMAAYPGFVLDPDGFEKTLREWLPAVIQLKNLAFVQSDSVVVKEHWPKFLSVLGSAYGDYLYYHYFYVGGGLQDAQNLAVLESLGQQVLGTADELLAGRNPQEIPKQEMANLLGALTQAWPALKISPALVDEGLKLKVLLLGGNDGNLSREDIRRAQAKLPAIKSILLKISPYYAYYAQTWDPQGMSDEKAEAYAAEARGALAEALRDAANLVEGVYDLQHLSPLVAEVLRLYPDLVQDPEAAKKMIASYAPLVADLKNMIFAENDSVMKKAHWESMLSLAGDAYSSYLYQVYFVKGHGLETAQALSYIEKMADQFIAVGANFLQVKKTHVLTSIEIKRLIDRVVPLEILPESLDAGTLRGLVSVVVNRLLVSPDMRIAGRLPQVINRNSLDLAQLEIKNWIQLEQFTASLFPKGDETYTNSQVKSLYGQKYKQKGLTAVANAGLKEMVMALDTAIPIALDSKERLIIENRDRVYNRASLAQVNLDRMIVRLFFRSYANDLSRLRNYAGITLSEAQTAYRELKPVAVKLGLIDEGNTTFAASRFREANMFVARGNGDNLVSFQEGVDLVAMIWSGLNINAMFKADTLQYCVGRKKASSETMVDKDCLTKVYMRKMSSYMSSMPYFTGFIQGITPEERAFYFDNVLKSAGHVPRPDNLVKLSDAALLPHVVQYIEMTFTKFDRDRNWVFDVPESLNAFPSFRNVIKEVARGQVSDEELDDLFTYILHYGKPPETAAEKLSYALNWRNKPDRWTISADRVLLSKILGYIADQMAKPLTAVGQ